MKLGGALNFFLTAPSVTILYRTSKLVPVYDNNTTLHHTSIRLGLGVFYRFVSHAHTYL